MRAGRVGSGEVAGWGRGMEMALVPHQPQGKGAFLSRTLLSPPSKMHLKGSKKKSWPSPPALALVQGAAFK